MFPVLFGPVLIGPVLIGPVLIGLVELLQTDRRIVARHSRHRLRRNFPQAFGNPHPVDHSRKSKNAFNKLSDRDTTRNT